MIDHDNLADYADPFLYDLENADEEPLALRSYFPQVLENLLHYNGFHVEALYGDWEFSPLTAESYMLIFLCSKQTRQEANNE